MNKFILLITLLIISSQDIFAQLSQKERNNLIQIVEGDYRRTNIEGCQIYKTKSGYRVLVITVVSPASSPLSYEEISIKANKLATEFVVGVSSQTTSVYELEKINSSKNESFSEKILQSTLGQVSEKQSLLKFTGDSGETVYAFYLVMSKTNAKNGLAGVMSMVIPGSGQFYKGKTAKGITFLGLALATGTGILVCESTRSSYKNKAIEQPKYAKEYSTDADNWETYRNVCIGAAGAVYLWNVIDAFFTKGAQRPVVKSKTKSLTLTPTASQNSVGLSLAFNF